MEEYTFRCRGCGEAKPRSGFHNNSSAKRGHRDKCRDCVNARINERRATDPEFRQKLSEYGKRHRERHPEKEREYQERNRERLKQYRKRYYQENRERMLQANARWKAENHEHRMRVNQAYLEKHREDKSRYDRERYRELAEYEKQHARQWRKDNPERAYEAESRKRAVKKAAPGSHTAAEVWELGESQDWLCAYCEVPLFGMYHVDHMIPLSRGGSDAVWNLAIACPPCNQAKYAKTAEEFMERLICRK